MASVIAMFLIFTVLTVASPIGVKGSPAGSPLAITMVFTVSGNAEADPREIKALEQKKVLDGKTVTLYGFIEKDGTLSLEVLPPKDE